MVRRALLACAAVLSVAYVGCQSSSSSPAAPSPVPGRALMSGAGDSQPSLTPEHVGKRVRVQLKTGASITGTVRGVEPAKDAGVIELNHGREIGRLTLRLSQVQWVEELVPNPEHAARQESQEERAANRFSRAREDDPSVHVVTIDFRRDHRHDEVCLLDMGRPLRDNPQTVIFADAKSKATLSVPIPEDPNASLVSWQWHAHILTGDPAKPDDRLERMNVDGQVVIDFKDVALPATLLLVGTPARVEHKETRLDALAPPRVLAARVLQADSCKAVLQRNGDLLTRLDSGQGALWVASQPANENEMVLSLYDPDLAHTAIMPQTRFTAQDAILVPAFLLEVANAAGVWQRVGGYPIPPFVSQDTPDTAKLHLEVARKKLDAGFNAPALLSVRVPDRAALKADVDVRLAGANANLKYKLVLAHGQPGGSGKPFKFAPSMVDMSAKAPLHAVNLDFSRIPREKFPAHVYLWHYASVEWKTSGGFLPPAPPLMAGGSSTPPKRRMKVLPAPFPHVKFIKFEGMAPEPLGDGVLTGSGFTPGGGTLGWGGPFVPFGFKVGTTVVNDETEKGNEGTKPPLVAGPNAFAFGGAGFGGAGGKGSGSASAGSVAIAIANCCCGCGGDERGTEPPGYTGRPGRGATRGFGDPDSGYNRPIFVPTTAGGYE